MDMCFAVGTDVDRLGEGGSTAEVEPKRSIELADLAGDTPRVVTRGSGACAGQGKSCNSEPKSLFPGQFDWYQATVHGSGEGGVISALVSALPEVSVRSCAGLNSYTHGADIHRGDTTVARVMWGGTRGVHVMATGDKAREVAPVLRQAFPVHNVTRADVCVDWIEAGLFDRLSGILIGFAVDHGLAIKQEGDWIRGEARTLYLGAKSAAVRLVLYEKGYECGGDRAWTRLEVRVRPQKEWKADCATWTEKRLFGPSRWVREALTLIGFTDLERSAVGTVWKPSDVERARAALVKQYGAILRAWADELGGWDRLGPELERAYLDRSASPAASASLGGPDRRAEVKA